VLMRYRQVRQREVRWGTGKFPAGHFAIGDLEEAAGVCGGRGGTYLSLWVFKCPFFAI